MTDEVIKDFLECYKQTHYTALANCTKELCESMLASKGIQALVTCRCKDKISLENKLRNMNEHRKRLKQPQFRDRKEIERSVKDLAGVRIALYVPQQKGMAMEGITNTFPDVDWRKGGKVKDEYFCKTCGVVRLKETECDSCRKKSGRTEMALDEMPDPPDTDEIYKPVFAGYVADHARVKLSPTQAQASKLLDWNEAHTVEIQIVSVLLHAWAQVEHDIVYKNIKAKASKEERIILDSLNGFIISSELLLDQLHTMITDRVESSKKEFPNKFALAIFLDGYIGGLLSDEEKNNLELKMLFGLLKAVNKGSQKELQHILDNLGFKENSKHTDINSLGERYSTLQDAQKPFLLARNMHIPFYIMERILSDLSPEEELSAQRRAGSNVHADTNANRSYRCRVLLSSILWIGQLYVGGTSAGAINELQLTNEEEMNAFDWPFHSPARFAILVDGEKARGADANEMDFLWDWFERQEKDSYFSFAFRISKLGVFGSFPDDLALLRKGSGDNA
jgi:ppGpp synthetase/RelA/SpoT-type nucleotidyltranferase